MEYFAAILTALFFCAFVSYIAAGNRSSALDNAGELLVKVQQKPVFTLAVRIYSAIVAVFIIMYCIHLYRNGYFGPSGILFLLIVAALQLGWISLTAKSHTQAAIHWHGIVTPSAGCSFAFLPWSHICYCKWTRHRNILNVMANNSSFDISIPARKVDEVNSALIQRIETRDSNGEIVNRDCMPFEYPGEPEPVKRYNRQFKLKTLILFMVVASSAFSWLGIHLHANRREQAALKNYKKLDVKINYHYGRVYRLDFSNISGSFSDDDLRHLGAFERIRILNLSETPLTDAGLAHIKGLTSLRCLLIENTQITNEGLKHLEGLIGLESIYYSGSKISDERIERLKKNLPKLKTYGKSKQKKKYRSRVITRHTCLIATFRSRFGVGFQIFHRGVEEMV